MSPFSHGTLHYRYDKNISVGMNLNNMSKMLKCAGDIITIKADDGNNTVTFTFESPAQSKILDFEMKLMDIGSEHFGISEVEYHAIVRMPSVEFARICKGFANIGDIVVISVTKEGVKFSTRGDIGTTNIALRRNTIVDKPEEATIIEMTEPVSLTFALGYMNSFTKETLLSSTVIISLHTSVEDAIKNTKIAKHLSLSPIKLHCSMLAKDTIKAAVKDAEAKRAKVNGSSKAHCCSIGSLLQFLLCNLLCGIGCYYVVYAISLTSEAVIATVECLFS